MRSVRIALVCAALLAGVSGCYTTTLRSGLPAGPPTVAFHEKWHHGLFWGIAELSGPYELSEICPQGWAVIETETSFLNGLLYAVSSGIYSPQTVTIRCSEGGLEVSMAGEEGAPLPPGE